MIATPTTYVSESCEWTLSPAGHRVVRSLGSAKVEGAQAHDRYMAVTPGMLIPRLEAAGLEAEVQQSRFTGSGQAIVTCTPHGHSSSLGYSPQCHILLDHRGRSSVKLQGGVLREVCSNAFTRPAERLHHCGSEIRDFVADPAPRVWEVLRNAKEVQYRIERLHRDGRGAWLFQAFRAERPRLATQAESLFQSYSVLDEDPSAWAFVQALTTVRDGQGRKVPSLESIASRVVDTLTRGAPITPEVFASARFN